MPSISAEEAILSLVAASPKHQVHGKKRIQKLSFLCKLAAAPISAKFQIRHFGVFSAEVAEALDFLCIFGELDTCEEQVGPNRYFSTVFSLPKGERIKPEGTIASCARYLADYSTPDLEVASTVAFFTQNGWSELDAIKQTKRLKPAISSAERIGKSKTMLKEIASIKAAGHEKRSKDT